MLTRAVLERGTEVSLDILLVQDNPHDVRLVRHLLSRDGQVPWSVRQVNRLEAALEVIGLEKPAVVILDMNLPDGAGLEALRRVRAAAPDVPVVALTGSDVEASGTEAIAAGAQDFLLKDGLDFRTLRRTVRHAIERQRIMRELDEANVRLMTLAHTDPLTGLLNRRGIEQALFSEVYRSRRSGTQVVALLIDLDNFKGINDRLGHSTGDVMLKLVSRTLTASVRPTDRVARIGGDEFLVLLPETRLGEGLQIAERIRLGINEQVLELASGPLRITASVGISFVAEETRSVTELMGQIEGALHNSKVGGKNRVSQAVSDGPGTAGHDTSVRLTADLLCAGKTLRAARQAIVSLADGRIAGYELLIRSSLEPLKRPDDLFRFCFENNILTLVDLQCLKTCIAAAADTGSVFHVNLFPSTILDTPVEQLVRMFPVGEGRPRFCVEISEQQILGDPSYLKEHVRALRAAGIQVSIDDVGFGRSCLESIVLLEPDIIKVDRKWVTGIMDDAARQVSLNRLVMIAQALNIELVAEGVETADDRDAVKELGIGFGQGYFWGRPA